jgi:phage/plasmid-like protein (TIGR03299 family)
MSHEIETHGSQAAFYSHKLDAWHRLGTVTTEAKTAEEALELAHADFTVEKQPLTATVLTPDGVTNVDVKDKFVTVRQNPFTGEYEVLGVVGKRYQVVQNLDNAEFLNALVGESGAHFETVASLYNGRKVFVSMKAPKGLLIGGRDAVDLYLMATNRHDGLGKFTVAATPIRPVCANTERLALLEAERTWSARHSGDVAAKVEDAQETLGVMWDYFSEFESWGNSLFAKPMDDAEFKSFIEATVFPEPKDEETDLVKRRRLDRQAKVLDLWKNSETTEGIRGTRWGAYNVVTEYVDWMLPIRDEDKRATRIVDDPTLDGLVDKVAAAL